MNPGMKLPVKTLVVDEHSCRDKLCSNKLQSNLNVASVFNLQPSGPKDRKHFTATGISQRSVTDNQNSVIVTLSRSKLWSDFNKLTTEMIISRVGRYQVLLNL